MTRRLIPNAWAGDHIPSGSFVAVIPKVQMVTHLGAIPFPAGEAFGVLYPRCTDVNGFRFAGQAHDTLNPACWEWDPLAAGDHWVSYPPPCAGTSPVIYDRDGVLHRHPGGKDVSSQGYRYVAADGSIVTGDQTYGPFFGLFEYTYLGDALWIGQAAYDGGGVQIYDGVRLLQLETGDCRVIRANRDGETVALAFTRPDGVVLISTTMAELRALPAVVKPEPPKPVPVPPDPPKPPQPTPAPPKPHPAPGPTSVFYNPKEYSMSAEEVGAIKVGPYFGRVVEAGAGKGPFGWYAVAFDRETPDDDCWWTVSKPDIRHDLIHTKVPCRVGADVKEAEDPFWYGKPLDLGRGILESPVLIKDPASELIVGYFTWPARHPTGGTASPSFVWVKRS